MNDEVEEMISRLENKSSWKALEEELLTRRLKWFDENRDWLAQRMKGTPVERAYQLMLLKLGIDENEAYIVEKTPMRITLHSKNFCPVISACDKLGLDTRTVCRNVFEKPMEELLRRVDPGIRFSRNYDRIRPYSDYCEEIISMK